MAESYTTESLTFIILFLFNIECCALSINESVQIEAEVPILDITIGNQIELLPSLFQSIDGIPTLTNDVPLSSTTKFIEQYTLGSSNDDKNLNIEQLIVKYGYKVQKHQVKTSDGYVLTLFRIPNNGPPAFLMHGLLSSADDWITAGPSSGIGYLLAAKGYDVWLGNARGNKHSRRHERLSPEDDQFWNFSWDEIGRYDLPAMIDHVLNTTARDSLKYVGHSQGTTAFFVMASERPEYNDKVSLMVALSAVAWMSHVKSPIVRLLSPINPILYSALKLFGFYEMLPTNALMKTLQNTFCGKKEIANIVCSNIVSILCGFNYEQVNVTNLPVFFSHIPSGASTKQLVHYGQEVVSGKFQRFDYGKKKNMIIYGTKSPPEYKVEKITAPIAIFYSSGDWLASVTDVLLLRNKLQNVIEFYKIPYKKFNHLDFLWAKDVKILIFNKLFQLFKELN